MPTTEQIERLRDKADAELKSVDPNLEVRGTVLSGIGDYFAIIALVPNGDLIGELIKLGWEKYQPPGIFDGRYSQHMMKRSERFETE